MTQCKLCSNEAEIEGLCFDCIEKIHEVYKTLEKKILLELKELYGAIHIDQKEIPLWDCKCGDTFMLPFDFFTVNKVLMVTGICKRCGGLRIEDTEQKLPIEIGRIPWYVGLEVKDKNRLVS